MRESRIREGHLWLQSKWGCSANIYVCKNRCHPPFSQRAVAGSTAVPRGQHRHCLSILLLACLLWLAISFRAQARPAVRGGKVYVQCLVLRVEQVVSGHARQKPANLLCTWHNKAKCRGSVPHSLPPTDIPPDAPEGLALATLSPWPSLAPPGRASLLYKPPGTTPDVVNLPLSATPTSTAPCETVAVRCLPHTRSLPSAAYGAGSSASCAWP